MAQQFGKTWWGAEWLKALTHIDFANRIPRGAAYARRGAVRSVEVKDGVITAKVQGSRRTPYSVRIRVPAFKAAQVEELMQRLLSKPAIISKLMNHELDPEVLTIARAVGLQVFPSRWNDLGMVCSCPDWAVPCKHLAAVIYMMSREIDNNPFLVFTMHGVDLLEELRQRGVSIDKQELLEVPELKSLMVTTTVDVEEKNLPPFRRIDCSRLHDLTTTLAGLLPPEPAFYTKGDFQQKYTGVMLRVVREAARILAGKKNLGEVMGVMPTSELRRSDVVSLTMDADGVCTQEYLFTGRENVHPQPYGNEFLVALTRLPDDYLPDYDLSVAAMHQALNCALQLLAHGTVVPQIVRLSGGRFAIRWLPATIDDEVRGVVTQLKHLLPPRLLQYKPLKTKPAMPLQQQTEHLLAWLLGRLMPAMSGRITDDDVLEFFFKNEVQRFHGVGETAFPENIRTWTDRFFLAQRQFRPSLLVDEDEDGGFRLHVAVEMEGQQVLLRDILSDNEYLSRRFAILREVSLLAALIPGLETYINSGSDVAIPFTTTTFAPFLLTTIPAIRLLGVRVMLPRSLQELLRPRVSIKMSRRQDDGRTYLRLDDMLQFNWQVAVGNELLTEDEFRQLVGHASGLIRFRQQYIYVTPADIERIEKALAADRPLAPGLLLQTALTESYEGAHVELTDEVRALIRRLTENPEEPVPAAVQATLRPYQQRGYAWMYRNLLLGFGSIIADDMGLGKTLQVITLLQRMKDDGAFGAKGRALIVVPTGLITNWQAELRRFAPALSCLVYHGPGRSLKGFDADILLTTYGVLRSDVAKLKKKAWAVMAIDEAQNIKNAATAQSKAVRAIPAATHIAMSGTPVENRLSEFWTIMDFANQGYLGTESGFRQDFATPIQRQGDERVAERFRRITAPFLLRRLKTDKSIITDLPDKVEQNELALLTDAQAALYHETLERAMQTIEAIEETDSQSLFRRQGLVLQMILALKQICNHPALFLKNGDIVPELSGKTEMLLSLLEAIVESGQKVLVFTQFREMGEMLSQMIAQRMGEAPLFLHGGCTIKQRQAMVERFQQSPHTDHIFLLSLKAAGTGLNLTAASHVIHYDLWWNPAVEAQATDRAYRIGQHQNVLVHRFITQNTFEERINQMIQDKRHLAEMTVAAGENWIGNLSNRELRELFG